jgi:hypothetical protein
MSSGWQISESWARTIRERIVIYLLNHPEPNDRTQIKIMTGAGASQATVVRYLAELIGQGLITERPFGTSMIYEVQFEKVISQGLVKSYEIFDLDNYFALHNQANQEWTGKVFKFGNMIYLYAHHVSGFNIGIPIYDKEWRELIEGFALGLNLEALFTGFIGFISRNR